MYCLETTNIFLIFKILLHCIETVHVRIADMEELEGLFDSSDDASDPSDDGKEQSQFPALNADVLRQIAMSLKPADVYSLSLTCKQFEETGKWYANNSERHQTCTNSGRVYSSGASGFVRN